MSTPQNEFHITFARPYHPETLMHLLHQAKAIHEILANVDLHIKNLHLTIGIGDANYLEFDVVRPDDMSMENLSPIQANELMASMRFQLDGAAVASMNDSDGSYLLDVVDISYNEYVDRFRLTYIA